MKYLKKYVGIYWDKYLLALFFLSIEAICDLMQPTIMSKIIDNGVKSRNMGYVLNMGGIMLLLTGVGAIGAVMRNIISSNVSQRFGAELRGDIFKKIQGFSFENIDNFEGASLITRLTSDVNQVQNFAHGTMRIFIKAPILCIGSLIMAFSINPSLTLILLGVIPVVSFIIYLNMKISYPFFVKVQGALDKVNGVIREYLGGVRVVKAFNRFDYEMEEFNKSNQELKDISIKGMKVMTLLQPGISLTVNIGIVLVIWFGGIKVNLGKMQVGQILAFINYLTQILFSLVMLSHVFTMFIRARASAERIGEVIETENTQIISVSPVSVENNLGKVEFKNVSFSYYAYEDTREGVLKDISFTCNKGETIGIIGSTGSGKTTLINLIPRFYDVNSGEIKIDGVDVRDYDLKDLREMIGIVPQKSMLFTGTILQNIRWGNEDASYEEVKRVAEISQAHGFISSFNEGYETILGQGGVNLSGGQKQRISIARALIKKPKILILDDSTSALDATTEGRLRGALKEFLKETTCIIIAQRITSVMGADRIIVLDNGKIVGSGTHSELMENCSVYQDIFLSQIGKEVV